MAAGRNFNKAIIELKTASKESDDDFLKTKAQWHLSLAYLRMGNRKEAENLLLRFSKRRLC